MPIYLASLNSGSNANCYYVGTPDTAVLVDAGLSVRETERRMKQRNLNPEQVKALFISHEHSDHITGATGLARKYGWPVYITSKTWQQSGLPLDPAQVRPFRAGRPVTIGSLEVLPFRKSHDAADPHSFVIRGAGRAVGVMTDIGYACRQVLKHFADCDAVFLESNYCEDMLEKGSYPYPLKKRIRSDEGHLSNTQALELFQQYRSDKLELLILSHLSKNNNHPQVVEELFEPHAGTTRIVVASRYAASEVFELGSGPLLTRAERKKISRTHDSQLSLF